MPKFGDAVQYNAGDGKENEFALVTAVLANGNLNLLYKETGGSWEAANDTPQGDGGKTWHPYAG